MSQSYLHVRSARWIAYGSAVMMLASASCHRAPGPQPPDAATPLAVEWAGCAVVRRGPRCELGEDRALALWVQGDTTRVRFLADQAGLTPRLDGQTQGGTRLTLNVPVGTRRLAAVDAGGRARWALELAETVLHPEIEQLLASGKGGKPAEAMARLQQIAAEGSAEERGPATAAYGRLQLAQADMERAEPALRRSMASARAEGRLSDEVRDGAALIWGLAVLSQRFADARAALEQLRVATDQYPEGPAWYDFHAGLLAAATGDLRGAMVMYRASERVAERLQRRALAASAAGETAAQVLTAIGRSDEAVTALSRPPPSEDPCARATWLLNRGWAMRQLSPRGRGARDEAIWSALSAARQAASSCLDPHPRFLATVNAADYALEIEDDGSAGQLVAELTADRTKPDALMAGWRADILGRWALRRGQTGRALASFQEQLAVARGAGLREESFRAEVGAGRALLAMGQRRRAVLRFEAAQRRLEQMLGGVPLLEGRGAFLNAHDQGVRHLIDALIDGGYAREAARTARLAHAAELAYSGRLDRVSRLSGADRRRWDQTIERYARSRREIERESERDWTLPRNALLRVRAEREARAEAARQDLETAYSLLAASLGPSLDTRFAEPARTELELTFFPSAGGWVVFATRTGTVTARRFSEDLLASNEAAAAVLAQLSPELETARQVRVFAHGAADRIDWHTVRWKNASLIASVEVAYALDLGGSPVAGEDRARKRRAVVMSNPSGDLPEASAEGAKVAAALANWHLTRLDGPAATRDALLSALPDTDLLHYAGHADVPAGGPLSGALVLAGGSRAELGDLLAVSRMPALIVLSACDAARTNSQAGSSLGLAQAFLLSGARAMVAPVRAIRDEDARTFMEVFYAALSDDPGAVSTAFRRAARADRPDGAWRTFRLLTK